MALVLVVEPDRRIRRLIAGILGDFGHRVQPCSNAGEARQWVRRASFDVLATDLVLGDDAADILTLARGLSVLTLSGAVFRAVGNKYQQPAALHDKPFRFEDLQRLVTAVARAGPAYALAA